jgi:NAD(P)-dependent dehydrogenase (short-subunit alcohol dehydrogenase family)
VTGALAGRSVLVTGAGRGVGRAIALACASAGADIVVAAPRDNGAETVSEIVQRGGSAVWVRGDVTRRADVDAAVAAAVARSGHLDVVVHNATSAHSSEVHRVEDVDEQLWNDHVAVSLRGAFHCAGAALPWLEQVNGRFILMTSPAGIEGSANLPIYGAVKGAIRGFVKSLAKEWGPLGVTVNCISPLAETPAMASAYRENPELEARLQRLVPLGRIGDPEADIAPAVVFLASDAGRYVTGQTLVVDGGRFTGL